MQKLEMRLGKKFAYEQAKIVEFEKLIKTGNRLCAIFRMGKLRAKLTW
jgi:hypothetical protein